MRNDHGSSTWAFSTLKDANEINMRMWIWNWVDFCFAFQWKIWFYLFGNFCYTLRKPINISTELKDQSSELSLVMWNNNYGIQKMHMYISLHDYGISERVTRAHLLLPNAVSPPIRIISLASHAHCSNMRTTTNKWLLIIQNIHFKRSTHSQDHEMNFFFLGQMQKNSNFQYCSNDGHFSLKGKRLYELNVSTTLIDIRHTKGSLLQW